MKRFFSMFFIYGFYLFGESEVAPVLDWHKSFNGSGEESHPHYVIQTKDLGFLMVGETGFVEDRSGIFLVKTDLKVITWQREFENQI